MPSITPLLTPNEIAAALKISKSTLRRLIEEDPNFKCFKVGNSIRITEKKLAQWIEAQEERGMA